jgi:hypothetical protein
MQCLKITLFAGISINVLDEHVSCLKKRYTFRHKTFSLLHMWVALKRAVWGFIVDSLMIYFLLGAFLAAFFCGLLLGLAAFLAFFAGAALFLFGAAFFLGLAVFFAAVLFLGLDLVFLAARLALAAARLAFAAAALLALAAARLAFTAALFALLLATAAALRCAAAALRARAFAGSTLLAPRRNDPLAPCPLPDGTRAPLATSERMALLMWVFIRFMSHL